MSNSLGMPVLPEAFGKDGGRSAISKGGFLHGATLMCQRREPDFSHGTTCAATPAALGRRWPAGWSRENGPRMPDQSVS